MKKKGYPRARNVLLLLVGSLTFVLLLYLWLTPNIEFRQTRDSSGFRPVDRVAYSESREAGGFVRQFRFVLDETLAHDTNLIFRFDHQNARVYLDGQMVYALQTSPRLSLVRTPGEHWAMIPLYREDVGKEVLVELRPVYGDYQNQEIAFYIGAKLSVYTQVLQNALPEIVLSLADIFVGLLLLAIAVYSSVRKSGNGRLYALSAVAISLGLWNFGQTDFAPLLLPGKNTFVYYISLTMLSISVFALAESAETRPEQKSRRWLEGGILLYGCFLVLRLILQLLGVLDLRQTVKGVHAALIVCSLALIGRNLLDGWRVWKETGEIRKIDCLWMLGVGVLLDLVNYYTGAITTKLFFVLLAVFLYVLLAGVRLFTVFVRQQQALEEKETQLAMSRITTMLSQIRSHFVFNVLNAISGMCKYDPEKADETIVRFSRYLRSNIDIMENDKNIPFPQEMERLEDYVVLEQIRFGDRIEFTADLETDQFLIPPLILQPIVENAIKHGISKRKEGGRILLRTQDTETSIVITVTDNGIGFPMEALNKQTSVGLRNIRFRLAHLVGGTMDIKSQLGVGTTVTLTIPKEGTYASDLR